MSLTLVQMVNQVRGYLNQFTTNRPDQGTFEGWVGDPPTGVNLSGFSGQQQIRNSIVELGHELIFVRVHDPSSGQTTVPPWFRQQDGSPANDDYPAGSVAVLNPLWPWWSIASAIEQGTNHLYPKLFAVKTIELESSAIEEKYPLPDDVDDILKVRIQGIGPAYPEREIWKWSIEQRSIDGSKVLHMPTSGMTGRPIFVTYRGRPTALSSTNPDAEWGDTGLTESAVDLPILYATARLLPAADAARTQTASVEQSDRSRLVQPGSARSAARSYMEMFNERLKAEQTHLSSLYPPRPHRLWNG